MPWAATEVGDDGFAHEQPLQHEASLQDARISNNSYPALRAGL